ncbi:MAG: hypothetical protein ACPL3P_04215 [Anaerolineales bacterium]
MAKKQPDIVIEAVRYKPNGEIDWVRVYEKRGATYSDHLLLSRAELVQRLQRKELVYTGKRIPYMASTFQLSRPVILSQSNGKDLILTENTQSNKDKLEDVPLI